MVYTPGFSAPEVAADEAPQKATDVFGVGLVLAHHLLGRTYTPDASERTPMYNVRVLRRSLLLMCCDSLALKETAAYTALMSTLFRMLTESPQDRPTIDEVLLSEPFASAAVELRRKVPGLPASEAKAEGVEHDQPSGAAAVLPARPQSSQQGGAPAVRRKSPSRSPTKATRSSSKMQKRRGGGTAKTKQRAEARLRASARSRRRSQVAVRGRRQ